MCTFWNKRKYILKGNFHNWIVWHFNFCFDKWKWKEIFQNWVIWHYKSNILVLAEIATRKFADATPTVSNRWHFTQQTLSLLMKILLDLQLVWKHDSVLAMQTIDSLSESNIGQMDSAAKFPLFRQKFLSDWVFGCVVGGHKISAFVTFIYMGYIFHCKLAQWLNIKNVSYLQNILRLRFHFEVFIVV